MGHRALVAFQNSDGKYNVHYSHWGAADLALKEPLQSGMEPGQSAGELDDVPVGHNQLKIDSETYASNVTLQELGHDVIQYWEHEAVYVVPAIGEVGAYVTLDFRLDVEADDSSHDGALVSPWWYKGEPLTQHIKPVFRGWKDVVTDLVTGEQWTLEGAKNDLEQRAYGKWGKPDKSGEIPRWSPRAYTPRAGVKSLSDQIAQREREITNPNR